VPPELFANSSSLPQLWFQSVDDDVSINATQLTNYDELIKRHEDAAQLIYGAELPAALPFTLRMAGSERVHMVQRHCAPAQHPLFADGSVWLGMMDATTVTGAPQLKVHERYQAGKPPPAAATDPSVDAIKQAVLKAFGGGGSSSSGSTAAAGDDLSVVTQLLAAGREMEAATAATHGLGSSIIAAAAMADNQQLMTLLAKQQLAQATAQLSSAQAAAVAAEPAVTELLQQLAQKQGNADSISVADAAKMLELIRGEYNTQHASSSNGSSSSKASATGSISSIPGADSSSSSSSRNALPQRTLLGRAGMLDSRSGNSSDVAAAADSQAAATSATHGGSSNFSSSGSSSSSTGLPDPASQEAVYIPFTPASDGSSSSSKWSSLVDPAAPLPPPPPSQAAPSGDYTDAWATHHNSSGSSSSSSTGADMTSGSSSSSNSNSLQMDFKRRGEVLRFLTLQHLQHHRSLGFAGSIIVVTRHTAEAIMQSRPLRRAMQRQRLILVLWDLGLEPRASHFMQVPAYNLMRLAAWGSKAHLGFWDLDEYLVLPSHKSISEEIHSGCLSGTLGKEPEAIVPTMWVSSNSWNATPELVGWMRHGYWSRAVQAMDYAMWPYTFCDGACKAMVNPTSDLMFQVSSAAAAAGYCSGVRSKMWELAVHAASKLVG
jgi:hypothetical protein